MNFDNVRILIVDDESEIHEAARVLSNRLDCPLELRHAVSIIEARDLLMEKFFDVVVIDLVGPDGSLDGIELLRYLTAVGSSADVVLMTHLDVNLDHTNLLNAIAVSRAPHVTRFIDKRKSTNFLGDAVDEACDRLRRSPIALENVEFLAKLILDRRRIYRSDDGASLREDQDEVEVEIERVCRLLFSRLPAGKRQTTVSLRFAPFERLGLSAAVAVRVLVSIGISGVRSKSEYECVLKIGPRAEIAEEASRYVEFVRFGVRLEERVEMLGFADADALGAIVYSMAGGSDGELRSLDELFTESTEAAVAVVDRLFSHTSWYETEAEGFPIRDFFAGSYRTDFLKVFDEMQRPLAKAVEQVGGELHVGDGGQTLELRDARGTKMLLPGRSFTGSGPLLAIHPWCLVHGDMHGGNVMVELLDAPPSLDSPAAIGRVNLIDYRQAGPGPRCIDAAALECAIRLSDVGELDEPGDDRAASSQCLARFRAERDLYRSRWLDSNESIATSPWASLSSAVQLGAQAVFRNEELSAEEYLVTCLLYGLRQFRYPMPAPARLRIAVWIAGMYAVYGETVSARA